MEIVDHGKGQCRDCKAYSGMWVFRGSREINMRMREFENVGVGRLGLLKTIDSLWKAEYNFLKLSIFPTPVKVSPFHVYSCNARMELPNCRV